MKIIPSHPAKKKIGRKSALLHGLFASNLNQDFESERMVVLLPLAAVCSFIYIRPSTLFIL